jgi:CRP/FNR family transcriptional regulator
LFVVRTGHVQYSRLATNGRQVVLGILAPGDVFGLGSLVLSPMQYIGTAEAVESSELIAWSARTIRRLAVKYPQLTNNVLHIALEYVAIFTERHEQLVTSTAEQRVARALSSLGATSGTPGRNGVEVRIKNEQLAALADVSVFTASRVLNGWARKGALSKTRGAVQIVSPERLLRD